MTAPRDDERDEPEGVVVGDATGGNFVSGVRGKSLAAGEEEGAAVGLRPVHEQGARLGWGRLAAEAGDQPVADNDGTGRTETETASGGERGRRRR